LKNNINLYLFEAVDAVEILSFAAGVIRFVDDVRDEMFHEGNVIVEGFWAYDALDVEVAVLVRYDVACLAGHVSVVEGVQVRLRRRV